MKSCRRHVGIVVAGHHAHIGRPPQGFEPMAGMGELGRKRDIDKVACDGHVVRLPAVKVAGDSIERIALMEATAAAPPIDVAEEALRREFAYPQPRQRPKMRVGQMCEHEGFAHYGLLRRLARDDVTRDRVTAAASLISIAYLPFSYELPMRIPEPHRQPPGTPLRETACPYSGSAHTKSPRARSPPPRTPRRSPPGS